MRARERQAAAAPPDVVTSYTAWCRSRGFLGYGNPVDVDTMWVAYRQFVVWQEERDAWCAVHGVDEGELPMDRSSPFDVDCL